MGVQVIDIYNLESKEEEEEQVIHYLNDSEPTLLPVDGSLF